MPSTASESASNAVPAAPSESGGAPLHCEGHQQTQGWLALRRPPPLARALLPTLLRPRCRLRPGLSIVRLDDSLTGAYSPVPGGVFIRLIRLVWTVGGPDSIGVNR